MTTLSKLRASSIMATMLRMLRPVLIVGLLGLAACTTPPTPPPTENPVPQPPVEPSPVIAAAESYQGVADAPVVLDKLNKSLEQMGSDSSALSVTDQALYGNLLLASGKYSEAQKVFEHLREVQPENKDALTALALLAGLAGDSEVQSALIAEAVRLYPTDIDILNLQAQNALSRGDSAAARRAWQASVELKANPDAFVGLALLALQSKKPKDALDLLAQAEALTKSNDLLFSLRSQAHVALREYPAAEAAITRAIDLFPGNAWYWLDRARLGWLQTQKPMQALADTRQALALDDTLFYAWEYQAEILEQQGHAKEAYQAYRKALSLERDFRFSYPAVATLAFRLQDYPQALAYAHEAAKDYPGEYAFPVIEALSLRFLGKTEQALTVLQKNAVRFTAVPTVSELFRFLVNPGNDFSLNATLTQEKKENIRVRVQFYQGCQYVLIKAYSSARAAFQATSESHLPGIPEIAAARDWLDHGF